MKITVNDKEVNLDKGEITVSELLTISKVENPEVVSVQRNGEFVDKKDLGSTQVKDGDKIDFLYFMGGGK